MQLSIHPSIGVARLGNSTTELCLSPDQIGGLPFDCDEHGNLTGPIKEFKDAKGLIKRQGQPFKIFDENQNEITLDSEHIKSIEWTVHLANKKAAWYQFSELEGNLLFGTENSYENRGVPLRNPDTTDRQTLIIDPGPRTILGKNKSIAFDEENVPNGYPARFPPSKVKYGLPVEKLGDLLTDDKGRLIVFGGYGHAGGNEPLTSYGGSNTWHDDISDGTVYCTVTDTDDNEYELSAWVIIGSPDFAPEIVNISTLSDTMFDVGVRNFDLDSDMYSKTTGEWNTSFIVDFKRDILPIINRISRYQWVSNVQSMMAFTSNIFDFSDPSEGNKENRKQYLSYFRNNDAQPPVPPHLPQQQLFKENGGDIFPMMPLNSGSNSVSNINVNKFMALNETQLFLLGQWAEGKFVNNETPQEYPVNPMDTVGVGNCVGLPMCPGIEVTWSMQNDVIYEAPYVIKQYENEEYYAQHGLNPSRDESEGGGCEPGDLTKRMACPWQADFFQCTVQYINFTVPSINKITLSNGTNVPLPPTYYTYWWPPQSPWDVIVGEFTDKGQGQTHLPAGQQVNYARGINSFVQMVEYWYALGFIRDKNRATPGYPYIVETERNNEQFSYKEVPVGEITGNDADNDTTIPVFFIEENKHAVKKKSNKAKLLIEHLEMVVFNKIEIAPEGLEMPRSGTRSRR
ncbi:CTQ-dependent lysine 6-oxidase LodA [Aquimarina sp. AU58]|uniref:CTQ-dependent lysine 6-oxidase LodA n=1 Tax=Aquimarina sp. AU58 TaxID=1874112 RepID=UPI000D6E89C8|nr:CTQ-dependent lysine 6-oxidase LodA [Aquimarina sp. AU58]